MNNPIRVSIIGGSGYGGGELIRILLGHPNVVLHQVTSTRFAGQPVSIVHPNLRSVTNLSFVHPEQLTECDLLIVAIPNGASMTRMENWIKLAPKVIDLGADFRHTSAAIWEQWYHAPHQAPEFIDQFVYGVPELYREQISSASYVAGPGCEAIVSILTLYPLIQQEIIDPSRIIIDAKMSSSQAGAEATASSHHPERSGVVRSYMPAGHRHTPEIQQALTLGKQSPSIMISATAVEMVRGLLVTAHTFLNPNRNTISDADIWKAYRTTYRNEPFIRLIKQKTGLYRFPEPKLLRGSNYCDIGFEIDHPHNRIVLIGAIDNLVKGTAGNAVQCMNLMCGFEETTALSFPGLHPV